MPVKCETYIYIYIQNMYPIYTYMYRILIAIFCLSVYAVQLVPPLNVNTSPGIILSRFLAITIVIACKFYARY